MRATALTPIALAALLTGCGGIGTPPEPVPADAENPIAFRFRGATPPDAVDVIAQACSDLGISVQEVDPNGFVETRWMDIAAWERTLAAGYPLRERQVQFRFEVEEAQERSRRLTIATYYQPNRPPGVVLRASRTYDRLVPTDHPGYQVALQLRTKIRVGLRSLGATLLEGDG